MFLPCHPFQLVSSELGTLVHFRLFFQPTPPWYLISCCLHSVFFYIQSSVLFPFLFHLLTWNISKDLFLLIPFEFFLFIHPIVGLRSIIGNCDVDRIFSLYPCIWYENESGTGVYYSLNWSELLLVVTGLCYHWCSPT